MQISGLNVNLKFYNKEQNTVQNLASSVSFGRRFIEEDKLPDKLEKGEVKFHADNAKGYWIYKDLTEAKEFGENIKPYLYKKNPNQIVSVAPEHKGLGLKAYSAGGLAVVAYEAPKSWVEKLGVDVRSILPYHSSSSTGKMMVVRLPKDLAIQARQEKKYPKNIQPEWIHEVPVDYTPSKNEFFAVIDNVQAKDPKTKKNIGFPYLRLEKMDIKGEIEGLEEGYFKTLKIPYTLFKCVDKKDEQKYFMHIPQVAAMSKAYGNGDVYKPGQIIGKWSDLYYANFCRAVADAMPQMAEKENFNPASIWMHDRPMFPLQLEIARRSYDGDKFYDGLRMHSTLHNPGYAYQGYYEDISGFLKIVFNSDDFKKVEGRRDFELLKDIISKDVKDRTVDENKRLLNTFASYCESMCDENCRPNITMMTIANKLANPDNVTLGTVSKNYGDEMKRLNDIAKGLKSKLASVETNDVTNGNLPASLGINRVEDFGQGGNGLSANKDGYTPYNVFRDKTTGKVINYDDNDIVKNRTSLESQMAEKLASHKECIEKRKRILKTMNDYKVELKKSTG